MNWILWMCIFLLLLPLSSSSSTNWVYRLNSTFDEHFDEVWRLEQLSVNLKQLKSAMCRLEQVILGDPRFSSCLSNHVVLYLVKFLHKSEYETDIKCAVVSILSRANFKVCGDVMEADVIPVLVKLLSDSAKRLSHEVETVLNIFKNQFTISDDRFVAYQDMHVFACYSFLYLSYKRSVALEKNTWNWLSGRLIDLIQIPHPPTLGVIGYDKEMIIGSALGVIGNFVRWGSAEQIESLITEHHLLYYLRRLLLLELKKFHMEGCRIISNLAARRNIVVSIVESGVVECLCKLLENEDFGVKFEAAWAVFNSNLV